MDLNFDWDALSKVGIGGICIVVIFVGYKIFLFFFEQWKNSTDAINKNTAAFVKLTTVFEESSERDAQWQKEISVVLKDTNDRVRDIQQKVI